MNHAATLLVRKAIGSAALKATALIAALGFVAYSGGLTNGFIGDDEYQIVANPLVHSISNIPILFKGGTFYDGSAALGSVYFRPLMMTAYTLLYSTFGANPFAFHLLQLLLQMACCFLLYLVFRHFIKPALALFLSLVFLVHPINSQAVYYIANLQEPLFFFFGILGLWTFIRFQDNSRWWLALTAVCLFLSLLSKESGILFVAIVLVYAFIANRRKFYVLSASSALLVGLYLLIKIRAVGFAINPNSAPIDRLSLWGRLLNVPAVVQFYLTKVVWPWQQANAYYWIYRSVTLRHFWLPLTIDLLVLAAIVWFARFLHASRPRRDFILFTLFAVWLGIGLSLDLQVIPLDFTVSETWFYVPFAGLLGMIGIAIEAIPLRLPKWWNVAIAGLILTLLAVPSHLLSSDWTDDYTLASHDISISKEDYYADDTIALELVQLGLPAEAKLDADKAVSIFPTYSSYGTLGETLFALGNFPAAKAADLKGLQYGQNIIIYQQLADLTTWYGDFDSNENFLHTLSSMFPQDADIWLRYAQFEYKNDNIPLAQALVKRAIANGSPAQATYNLIMNQQPMTLTLEDLTQTFGP